ncbi:ATP-dependent helicase [Breznakiellaceae bacterium SP9]
MNNSTPDYLDALNPEQREAVLHSGAALLILAGAGSGKTRVITSKIAYLIKDKGLDPRSILAVTFTNKAAREMAERARRIDPRAQETQIRTFHSFGAWFLRRYGGFAGLKPGFVIYDDDDVISLLTTLMPEVNKQEVKRTAHSISRAKDYFLRPDDADLASIDYWTDKSRKLYAAYEERLAEIGNVDFGDLIKKPVEILQNNPELAGRIRNRFRVILVDEYQDSNVAQAQFLKALYGEDTYLCVVGDDDQSIYRFRGAEVKNILEFPKIFAPADIIRLERNYRSTEPIVALAASVVAHNESRLGKTLRAEKGGGKLPVLCFLSTQDEEVDYCAKLIDTTRSKQGTRYADWAILYRTNAQSMGFETEFLRRGIPYQIIGSLKFYDREEIKDALALLSFLVNPRDEVAFRRVANKPARGLGPAALSKIIDAARTSDTPAEAFGDIETAGKRLLTTFSAKAKTGLRVFLRAIENGRSSVLEPSESPPLPVEEDTIPAKRDRSAGPLLLAGEGLSVCVARVLLDSGIAQHHAEDDAISGSQRIGNLQELINAASLYSGTEAGLLEFLEHIELDRSLEGALAKNHDPNDGAPDAVTLITMHNTKGLEFKRVLMTGLETGLFPHSNKTGEDLEEERRLFYVGATRAMDELYLTCARIRRMYGRTEVMEPSRFLSEIDAACIKVIGDTPRGFKTSKANTQNKSSIDGRWSVGDRVFHDDQGYGAVTAIKEDACGSIVEVHFESGVKKRFMSQSQSSRYLKIGHE